MGSLCLLSCIFFFKQKTAYEMRISDWSSDVCSSDLRCVRRSPRLGRPEPCPTGASALSEFARQARAPVATGQHGRDFQQPLLSLPAAEIGRASCRERVCQYV